MGVQASQAVHAALAFAHEHPVSPDSSLVLLGASDELDLCWLLADAEHHGGLRAVAFYEPDLGNELTAVALAGKNAVKLCRKFPLLFREEVNND